MAEVVVVGSGIASLLAAAIAAQQHHVTILEAESKAGGLLRSTLGPRGVWVDRGTHIPRETGDAVVDEILFSQMSPPMWRPVAPIRAGHVLGGRVDHDCESPSTLGLPPTIRRQVEVELRSRAPSGSSDTLRERAVALFGPTLTDELLRPMMVKLFDRRLEELAPDAHRLFFGRVAAFTEEESRRLKAASVVMDQVLAFHNSREGAASLAAWYPAREGVGRWIDDLLTHQLREVDLITNAAVSQVTHRNGVITGVTTRNGDSFPVDRLIWGAGRAPFLRACGSALQVQAPLVRHVGLHHMALVPRLDTSAYYLNIFDSRVAPFRITIYDNLSNSSTGVVTTETMLAPADRMASAPTILSALKACGLADDRTQLVDARIQRIERGFPIPTPHLNALSDDLEDSTAVFRGVAFVGRGAGRGFFMADVLRDTVPAVHSLLA